MKKKGNFTSIVLKSLEDSGWSLERNVDFSMFRTEMEELGFEYFDKSLDFLQAFYGLELYNPYFDAQFNSRDKGKYLFNVGAPPIRYYEDYFEEFSKILNKKFSYLGVGLEGHFLMTKDGKMYHTYGDSLFLVGIDVEESLINMLGKKHVNFEVLFEIE